MFYEIVGLVSFFVHARYDCYIIAYLLGLFMIQHVVYIYL